MTFWLASARDGQDYGWIQRFDPRFWTVNFPRPMVAAVTTTAADGLRVDATFLTAGDLCGLIWASADTLDHPLLAYEMLEDYSGATLSFRWRSEGVVALDAINGPTLTINGMDSSGAAHTWYVRLWNYAVGTPTDAVVTLPFSALAGGWVLGVGDDPVWPAAISEMFVSLVAPGYVAGSVAALPAPVVGWAEMSGIVCSGDNAMLVIGDVWVPPHGLALTSDFDDSGTQTPARLVRTAVQLGYRGSLVHYVGMSHHFGLVAAGGGFVVDASVVLNAPAVAWHSAFLAACGAAGLSPVISVSFEVLAQYCPVGWGQQAFNGDPALTGWVPPSTLLSPAHVGAMGWLRGVASAFVALMVATGVPVRIQVGEPWWWIMSDGRICLYDPAARVALGGAPVEIPTLRAALSGAQQGLLDAAGVVLAAATAGIVAAVRAAAGSAGAECLLLAYLPTVLDPTMPEAMRADLPVGWASPAFDRLQVEDYDWVTGGQAALRAAGYALVDARLGYPVAAQDYFSGFVAAGSSTEQWRAIDAAADEAVARGCHEVFVWAAPEVCRDGYTRNPGFGGEDDMQAVDEVCFPLALPLDTRVAPEFSTAIVVTASGYERRNSLWGNALLRFDVGPGVRSDADIGTLIAFFRARRGAARGFLLGDPTDFSSCGMTGVPGIGDQVIGNGDGTTSAFQLVKNYGPAGSEVQVRPITRPRPGTLVVAVNGVAVTSGWTLSAGGVVRFASVPAAGAVVTAGFLFDVPVRFESDTLQVSGATFGAGEAPSVPVVEIREAS